MGVTHEVRVHAPVLQTHTHTHTTPMQKLCVRDIMLGLSTLTGKRKKSSRVHALVSEVFYLFSFWRQWYLEPRFSVNFSDHVSQLWSSIWSGVRNVCGKQQERCAVLLKCQGILGDRLPAHHVLFLSLTPVSCFFLQPFHTVSLFLALTPTALIQSPCVPLPSLRPTLPSSSHLLFIISRLNPNFLTKWKMVIKPGWEWYPYQGSRAAQKVRICHRAFPIPA